MISMYAKKNQVNNRSFTPNNDHSDIVVELLMESDEGDSDFQRDDSPTFKNSKKFADNPSKNMSKIVEEEEVEMGNITQNKTTTCLDDNSMMQLHDFVSDQPVAISNTPIAIITDSSKKLLPKSN